MNDAIREAYAQSVPAWREGPVRLYRPLAEALLDHAPVPVSGARVLDAGAGSGVAGDAARRRGAARVVGVDLAPEMLRGSGEGVAADIARLPFAAGAFDLVVAGFSLGHLPDPVPALRELRRVAPALLASAFAESWTHPAKGVVERVLADRGYRAPDWYTTLKAGSEHAVADPERLVAIARSAGYTATAGSHLIATGLRDPGDMVSWRLGMAHHAPFVASLPPATRAEVRREAARLLLGAPEVVVPMLVLTGS